MVTVPRKGEFYDTESASGEWARGENYGDGTTGDERVAAARAKDYVAPAVKMTGSPDMPSTPAKKISFKEAFASAKDGSTFDWNGKKYKKEYADKKGMSKDVMGIKSAAEKRSATRMADAAATKPKYERRSDTRLRASKASSATASEANMMDLPPKVDATDAMRASSRAAAKEVGARRRAFAEAKAKADDKASYKKGGSVRGAGAAIKGVKPCKIR